MKLRIVIELEKKKTNCIRDRHYCSVYLSKSYFLLSSIDIFDYQEMRCLVLMIERNKMNHPVAWNPSTNLYIAAWQVEDAFNGDNRPYIFEN